MVTWLVRKRRLLMDRLNSRKLRHSVVTWFRSNGREFPWRRTSDPFHILIAEVLLRQTQASRVVVPYTCLISMYPDPESLARADVDELRLWFRPLGLVRRADKLVHCARRLLREYGGQVPRNIQDLKSLPGIGIYSAHATLCMAFGRPVPMIDGGSGRVLRRILGLPQTGPAYLDKCLWRVAESIVPNSHAREFNLALIDIGAAYCRPRRPSCCGCPARSSCSFARGASANTRCQQEVIDDD